MAIQFSTSILDTHIAPGVSKLTAVDIPDMTSWSKESSHWIANFFLNSTLNASFEPPMNAYAYNFLRRSQFAFSEHHLARESTLAFIAGGGQSPRGYADALFHWECFLGQAWHAFAILIKVWNTKIYQPNDGSVAQRLNAMYNQMKHVESRIDCAQMIPGATVPVWLTNEGLQSVDINFTYVETSDVLRELAMFADALSNPTLAKDILFSANNA